MQSNKGLEEASIQVTIKKPEEAEALIILTMI